MLVALSRRVDEEPERLLAGRQLVAIKDSVYDFTTQVLRGDRRVRPGSEEASVLARCHRREQLSFAGAQRSWGSHGRLREFEQVFRAIGIICEQPPQIGLPFGLRGGVLEVRNEHGVWSRGNGLSSRTVPLCDGSLSEFYATRMSRGHRRHFGTNVNTNLRSHGVSNLW